jgi:hypothetical protein
VFARARSGAVMAAGAILVLAAVSALPLHGAEGPHKRRDATVTSTQRTEFRILQDKAEKGRETVEKKVFSNNTVLFTMDTSMMYGPGLTMSQHIELLVEEESFFPRSLHVVKNIMQPDSTSFEHRIDVEMYSNVAVVSSVINNQAGSRRVVVPTGIAVSDVGVLGYLYQTLFWYDREMGGGQRFEWLDAISSTVNGGELKLEKEETIAVMGKKTKVSVFNVEREKYGAAKVWVDSKGTIVRGEQNFLIYELVKKSS